MNGYTRWNSWESNLSSMKIPAEEAFEMDNKLKFSDRLKALLKTEARQDIDPYIFSEPEPFHGAGKHNNAESTKNSRMSGSKNNGSKGKCPRKRIKVEHNAGSSENVASVMDNTRLVGDNSSLRNVELRIGHGSRVKEDSIREPARRLSRDHTLLYYPRAGDEISDSDSSSDELAVYQRHWFSGDTSNVPRATRLTLLRSQLRRRLIQLHKDGKESETLLHKRTRRLLEAACRSQRLLNGRLTSASINKKETTEHLLVGGPCLAEGCQLTSLPCTRHCSRHIMLNADQLLFEHCTAKFSDNTQCCVPVFDVAHELPLCPEHARKRDNYHRKAQESKPKKSRKKPASPTSIPRPKSTSSSSKSRPKKRKRPPSIKPIDIKPNVNIRHCQQKQQPHQHQQQQQQQETIHIDNHHPSPIIAPTITPHNNICNNTKTLNIVAQNIPTNPMTNNLNLGLGLGSLGLGPGLNTGLRVELDQEVFAALDPNEHDFGNVLNTLPVDLNELFLESRNGEYEQPSKEEAEELERALEEVDKDVRSLEQMEQTRSLLERNLERMEQTHGLLGRNLEHLESSHGLLERNLEQSHGLLEPALLAQLMSDIAS
ncbi:INO80 complex subunit D-like isoform X1 [Microplitis mediator]|uniref:INO80 complex subunit D-like isoform X1 n=1 Tax=Microplitis mediator TaxID=375433 RepID=UPI0025565C08|nr:INO80 complex subunit D-like isoform X1 [Microplitis mediator]